MTLRKGCFLNSPQRLCYLWGTGWTLCTVLHNLPYPKEILAPRHGVINVSNHYSQHKLIFRHWTINDITKKWRCRLNNSDKHSNTVSLLCSLCKWYCFENYMHAINCSLFAKFYASKCRCNHIWCISGYWSNLHICLSSILRALHDRPTNNCLMYQ